jgi:ornithine cyclodeaminase/alanine dehydrogenase-like protein (mu-crystallin family)
LEAVLAVRPLREVRVVDSSPEAAETFCLEMTEKTGVPIKRAATAAEAVREADVVCTATTSRVPVFDDVDLKPGVHVNAVGSYRPDVREVPEATVARATIVVDHRESALAEAGDLLMPLRAGAIREDRLATELGDVVDGRKPGRTSAEEVTLFKSVGVAVQDLAAAARVFRLATERRLGVDVPI